MWAVALGPACAARAALVAKSLTPPGGVSSAMATFEFDNAMATQFLMHPLFSGCTNWPRLE